MTKKELNRIRELFSELINIMKKYGQYVQRVQFKYICEIIEIIDTNLSSEDKTDLIVERYENITPPHDGLSEFYIEYDNPDEMWEVNNILSKIKKGIWEIMQNYV